MDSDEEWLSDLQSANKLTWWLIVFNICDVDTVDIRDNLSKI